MTKRGIAVEIALISLIASAPAGGLETVGGTVTNATTGLGVR